MKKPFLSLSQWPYTGQVLSLLICQFLVYWLIALRKADKLKCGWKSQRGRPFCNKTISALFSEPTLLPQFLIDRREVKNPKPKAPTKIKSKPIALLCWIAGHWSLTNHWQITTRNCRQSQLEKKNHFWQWELEGDCSFPGTREGIFWLISREPSLKIVWEESKTHKITWITFGEICDLTKRFLGHSCWNTS